MMLLAASVLTGCDGSAADGLFDSDNGGDGPTPPPEPVAVESVILDKATMVLKIGTDGTLKATVLPENATNKSMTWISDKPEVATVDQNGKVTGVAEGTATITVTTTDGAKTASCEVTVADEVYTVSFNMNGHGTQLDNQTVAKNGKIVKPTDPIADGVNFKGWYKEEGCTTAWNFDTDIVSVDNTILYAKWVAVYKVSFVGNGGSGSMNPEYVETGENYRIPESTFTAPKIPVGAVNGGADIPFKCWKDGNGTEYAAGDLISPVTTSITLTAQWAKPVFSISTDKQVYFSEGNLQAIYNGTSYTWGFAEHQYDYVGDKQGNTTIGSSQVNGAKVDLFGWSGDTAIAKWGISTSEDNADYSGDFKDWGLNVGDGSSWYTLSGGDDGEWTYLLDTRITKTNNMISGSSRYATVKVNGVSGLLIFPDEFTWTSEMGIAPTSVNSTHLFESGTYSISEFEAMETYGAVFLPTTGTRTGNVVSYSGARSTVWSKTINDSTSAKNLRFNGSQVVPYSNSRKTGCAVRLVIDAE